MSNPIQVGINYPWLHYGWDFGDPPPGWTGELTIDEWRARNRQQIADDFREFARTGICAVRWFVLADGLNFGMGSAAPQVDGAAWRFAPLPEAHAFYAQCVDDFEFVLQTCAEQNLKLLPSLLDFHFCFPGSVVDAAQQIIKCGRAEVVLNAARREEFFERVLEPLLRVSLNYPQTIYAWEPINEPEWCTQPQSWLGWRKNKDPQRTIPLAAMRDFISAAAQRINRPTLGDGQQAFDSTVGFANWETIRDWQADKLGLTLQQFHYYAQDDRQMPSYDLAMRAPCIIGEFASAVERPWPELQEFGQAQTLANRLAWIAEKGYSAAFLWSARAQDQATLWGRDERLATAHYLQQPTDGLA